MNTTIEIIIDATGQTRVETKGFVGGACRQASEFIERALGQATSERMTSEFYQTTTIEQTLQEGQA